jgi:hypothetical protein
MKKRERIFPLTIEGITKIGIENWLSNYYIPVTGIEYKSIYEKVLEIYIKTLCDQEKDEVIYLISVANIKIVRFITDYIVDILKVNKLKKEGYQYAVDKDIIDIGNLYNYLDNKTTLSFKKRFIFDDSSIYKQRKQKLKTLISYVNNFLKERNNITKRKTYFINQLSTESKEYCQQNNINPIYLYYKYSDSFKNKEEKLDYNVTFKILTEQLMYQIGCIYPFIRQNKLDDISINILDILNRAYQFFNQSLSFIKNKKDSDLLTSSIGSPLIRTFVAAWRYTGNNAVGFPHGNTYATCFDTFHIENDALSIVNQCNASSKGQFILFKKLAKTHSRNLRMARISHLKKSLYSQSYKKIKYNNKNSCIIKKVMIVGFPMNDLIYPWFPAQNTHAELKLEIEIIKILKKSGYDVLYKAHPDRLDYIISVISKYADEVIEGSFEDVYNQSDCILFTHSKTTTFGFAMLTNTPIVLINTKETMWDCEALKSVNKRCNVVTANSLNGMIKFDKNELIDSVASSSDTIDYEVVRRYAL